MWPIEWTSAENFRKSYKSRNLPRSGLLEPFNPADGLQPPLISGVKPKIIILTKGTQCRNCIL